MVCLSWDIEHRIRQDPKRRRNSSRPDVSVDFDVEAKERVFLAIVDPSCEIAPTHSRNFGLVAPLTS
jgi:hypothetical protein